MNRVKHTRLYALALLFLCIQYQIWASSIGLRLTNQLSDDLNVIESQNKHLVVSNKNYARFMTDAARDELKEERLRQVYHLMSDKEEFVNVSALNGVV